MVDAQQYLSRLQPLDYQEADQAAVTEQPLQRVQQARELGVQVVHNLRTAHERDVQRFKARRAGLYLPKVHHFSPGDFVFVLAQGLKPGGTLGIRARNEVMRVLEVRPSGVLILTNQAGQRIERHMEHCVPCMLPNLLGETHAGLVPPPAEHPCQVCKEHTHWGQMLLCDNCDAGYHTFCLSPPLEDVPDGDWLCPDCIRQGMDLDKLAQKRAGIRHDKRSRPNLEMPGPQRLAKAQRMANDWHGQAVSRMERGRPVYGRVFFTDVLNPRWFKITWEDGSDTEHMGHIFRHLTREPEEGLPAGLPPKPAPVVVMAAAASSPTNGRQWPGWKGPATNTVEAVAECLSRRFPGWVLGTAWQEQGLVAGMVAHMWLMLKSGLGAFSSYGKALPAGASSKEAMGMTALCRAVSLFRAGCVLDLVHTPGGAGAALARCLGDTATVVHNHPTNWVGCPEHADVLEGSGFSGLVQRHNAACGLLDCGDVLLPLILHLAHQLLECVMVKCSQPDVLASAFPALQFWLEERKVLGELLIVHPQGEGWPAPYVWLILFRDVSCKNKWLNFVLPVGQWAVGHLYIPADA